MYYIDLECTLCFWWWQAMRGSTSQLWESLGLSPVLEWVEINPWDHLNAHRCQWDHSRQSVLLLLSSSERERLFSPHFLSVVLSWSHGIKPIGIRGPCKLKIQIKVSKIRLCKGYQQIDGPKIFIQYILVHLSLFKIGGSWYIWIQFFVSFDESGRENLDSPDS